MSGGGRLSVEAWSPEYGSPLEGDDGAPVDGDEPTGLDFGVEVPVAAWEPRRPPSVPERPVAFTDGVRRVDGNLVWTADDGTIHLGLAASVAAGVVRCDGEARITDVAVDRVLLLGVPAEALRTRSGTWRHRPLRGTVEDPGRLSIELQQVMADLEVSVAADAAHRAELVVVDGPIRRREGVPNAVGHIKTHHHRYLPPALAPIIGELDAGERTPMFAIGAPFPRLSWYLRLPGPRQHPWSGIVRHEIAVDDEHEARRLADLAAALIPRFASRPARDPRAPQNLTPISGLESQLRHRLGDGLMLYRALRAALA